MWYILVIASYSPKQWQQTSLVRNKAECAGKKALEKQVEALDEQFPDVAKGVVEFSTPLAHLIIAGEAMMRVQ